ncbi:MULTISPECIES: DUF4834 domain-containing protein [Larkinella]|jgi:UPF0716 family protein affecting phage T7 exclusion|uniref:DUF4834 domain-containing protein n=2 Tax=Larkinella TaxID=332157 RepID=A0A5N1JHP7_9BACT|nr:MULTISPECIES: DUF4834 domain-containing protein [Larkinella]KAA9355244.1 DUF4834 domain-containing protein [Larkinella humicola]RCR70303.1 DUF4834 domain-containing protein [Larkinella punicea]
MIFKFLFVLLLLIAFVPPVRRFFFWLLVGRQLAKEQRKANERFNQGGREGETRVYTTTPGATDSKLKGGEYVDYDEVK